MFQILYNTSIFLYGVAIKLASFFNKKAKLFIEGRKMSLPLPAFAENQKRVWFHCASLGEFEQALPLIEELKKKLSDKNLYVIVSFFSPSGYEIRKNYSLADVVCYLPLDTPENAKRFVTLYKPDLAIFVKYEFWFNFLKELQRKNIPAFSVSAIFRKEQIFFKSYGKSFLRRLRMFQMIFTQDGKSLNLLKENGISQVMMAGDTRYDRVYAISEQKTELPEIEKFCGNHKIFVIGSTWDEDMHVLFPIIESYKGQVKFIIAPHEITAKCIQVLVNKLGREAVRLSAFDEKKDMDAQILIVDSIGLLSRIYRYGHFAYVGGAFGQGLHNILEAACYGMPIFFGNKNYKKFKEAIDLIQLNGAFPIKDKMELEHAIIPFFDEEKRKETAKEVKDFVKNNTGATAIILQHILKVL
ncbi:MAG: 3-deoxy-D-manno-octulosonic acid transferase [Cyclobacteriaceae bacterium]|nr:3-deoxy-D-manno-octulosonic acid transferase [Cyclobacteriaceae bacterium]